MELIPSTIDPDIHVILPSFIPVWNSTLTDPLTHSAIAREYLNYKAHFKIASGYDPIRGTIRELGGLTEKS